MAAPAGDEAGTSAATSAVGPVAVLGVTLAGNMPANAATLGARPAVDAARRRALRRRWDRSRAARVASDVAFVRLAPGVLAGR